MKNYVIIVAGGSGTRMKSDIPKQFIPLAGKPVLMRTIDAFIEFDPKIEIILVLPVSQIAYWKDLCNSYNYHVKICLTEGGKTRFHSVKNGLKCLTEEGVVGVHDGVRPFVNQETIKQAYHKASVLGAVIPIRNVEESLRYSDQTTNYAVVRDNLKIVQTPQVFKTGILIEAYNKKYKPEFTDDASLVERSGHKIYLIEGNRENIKLTTPFDFKIGEALLNP